LGFNGDLYPTAGATSVMTTKGDMVDYNTARQRLAIGSANQILQVKSSLPSWETVDLADTVLTTQGDVLYENASGLARLGFGTSGDVLTTKGTGANPVWETPAGGGKFVYGRGLAAFGDAGYVYYPFFSGSLQYGGTESQHTQTLYFAYTIERNNCTVIANSMSVATYIYVRDDGADVAGITISAGGTGQFDSGSISVSIASGSACCYARDGNSDSSSITVNGIITTCST
jgi:hypothetical protein